MFSNTEDIVVERFWNGRSFIIDDSEFVVYYSYYDNDHDRVFLKEHNQKRSCYVGINVRGDSIESRQDYRNEHFSKRFNIQLTNIYFKWK